MAIQSLSRASIANANRKYNTALAGNPLYTDMELISTTVLTGAAPTVTFSSIPQVYKHLQIRIVERDSDTPATPTALWMWFNNDTTSGNYRWHRLYGNSVSALSGDSGTTTRILVGVSAGAGAPANVYGASIVDVLDYASTSKNKTIRALAGGVTTTTPEINLNSGVWLSTAAITTITVAGNANMIAGTRVSLYGIKG